MLPYLNTYFQVMDEDCLTRSGDAFKDRCTRALVRKRHVVQEETVGATMKTLGVARKTLLELWREPLLLGLLLLFPVVLVGFYYVAFGQTEGGLATYLSLLVLNEDEGHTGGELVEVLRATEWDGDPVFDVELVTDRRAAEIALRERKVALLLVIPPDFSAVLSSRTYPAELSLAGDPNSDTFIFARSFLNGLLREFAHQAAGWQDEAPPIDYEFLPGTGTMSDFDFGVGGIIIFGVMFLMITTATVMVRENVTGTLRRLQLTGIGAGVLLLGVTLSQMAAAAVQVPITFGAAVAMGFQNNGSLLLAMVIGLLVALSAVGVGLDRRLLCPQRRRGGQSGLGGSGADGLSVRRPVPHAGGAAVHRRRANRRALRPAAGHPRRRGHAPGADLWRGPRRHRLRAGHDGRAVGAAVRHGCGALPAAATAKGIENPMPDVVLRTEGLTKRYGDLTAVKDLTLEVYEGEVFGFLGPNGAGKTTSINMMCGLLKPDAGRVLVRGVPMDNGDDEVRARVGVCPQEIVLWERLTCLEQLQFIGQMYGLGGELARRRGEQLLEELDLVAKRRVQARALSGGMKRRLNLAMALVHDPEIVVLDEPEAGLDPQSRIKVREYIQSLARSKTVILTTHNMDEADRVADRVAIIDHGELLVLDTPEALKRSVGEGDVVEIDLDGLGDDVPAGGGWRWSRWSARPGWTRSAAS